MSTWSVSPAQVSGLASGMAPTYANISPGDPHPKVQLQPLLGPGPQDRQTDLCPLNSSPSPDPDSERPATHRPGPKTQDFRGTQVNTQRMRACVRVHMNVCEHEFLRVCTRVCESMCV